jgi:hypothetical protein
MQKKSSIPIWINDLQTIRVHRVDDRPREGAEASQRLSTLSGLDKRCCSSCDVRLKPRSKAACRKTSVYRRSICLIRTAFVARHQYVRKTLSDRWVVGNGTFDHFRHRPKCSAVVFELSVLFFPNSVVAPIASTCRLPQHALGHLQLI